MAGLCEGGNETLGSLKAIFATVVVGLVVAMVKTFEFVIRVMIIARRLIEIRKFLASMLTRFQIIALLSIGKSLEYSMIVDNEGTRRQTIPTMPGIW
ncbi:hypothetical protein ANN_15503 [Periplaneta americana]|uniref:Uncharacterized protein n=1 Tax=Periplaneta americana TaxID=6978 RepID=A0ABQ8SGJ2_PERAM|nr:hypothetical protein ANN_15503 [Periplaneta americana]